MSLERLLLLFGLGFLVMDVRAVISHVAYWRRRPKAVLVWPARSPVFFTLQLLIGGTLGLLLAYNLAFRDAPAEELFGEGMMFVYYSYAVPLANRVERGFYGDGVWTDGGFVPYWKIGAVSWREEPEPVLLLASRQGGAARRLLVPGELYGATRRVMRDLIEARTIQFSRPGLDLGLREDKDDT
ncbi:MAG: hypothetical protein EHM13_13490 [Acidobacteria bacterium]|nr:MAG: hypothetical protein EHM13_13490 [Acidobacteriota bacterium]